MASTTPRTTKREFYNRAVAELNLDVRDPFTNLLANAFALVDQRDALELEAAALRERNVMMRERLNVVVEQLVTARRSVWEVWNRTSSVLFATEADANKYMQMHSAAIGLIKRELPILAYVAIPDEQEPT